jgi:antitoxin MazE
MWARRSALDDTLHAPAPDTPTGSLMPQYAMQKRLFYGRYIAIASNAAEEGWKPTKKEGSMQVAKWGNSLAVRLPAAVVEALELKEGDDIEIHVVDKREFAASRKPGREELLKRLRAFRGAFPPISSSTGKRPMPVISSTPTYCCTSHPAIRPRRTGPNSSSTMAAISVQVLNEIANVARRKMAMSWAETRAFLSTVRALLPVQPITIDIHETGLSLAERY